MPKISDSIIITLVDLPPEDLIGEELPASGAERLESDAILIPTYDCFPQPPFQKINCSQDA
jgi:hypothetical protein